MMTCEGDGVSKAPEQIFSCETPEQGCCAKFDSIGYSAYFLQAANVLSLIERLWKHLCSKANDQHLFQTILDLRDGVCSLLYSQPNSNSRSFLSGELPADVPVLWRDNITFRALPYWRCLI